MFCTQEKVKNEGGGGRREKGNDVENHRPETNDPTTFTFDAL